MQTGLPLYHSRCPAAGPECSWSNLATASQFVLIVFQLTVRDLKSARSLVAFLKQNEYIIPKNSGLWPIAVKKRGPLVRMETARR